MSTDTPSRPHLTPLAPTGETGGVENDGGGLLSRLANARWIILAAGGAVLVVVGADLPIMVTVAVVMASTAVAVAMTQPARPRQPAVAAPAETSETPRPDVDAFLSALPNPVVMLDRALAVMAFNPPSLALLPHLKIGEPIAFALRNPDVIDAAKAIAERGGSRRVDYSERVPVERAIEAQITAIPGASEGGAVLLVLRDVTQAHRIEQMRADFVANASHELRTPLASVLGFIETLQGPAKNDAPARDRFLEIMRSQATRMSRLIDDLLSLSRIELNAHVRPETRVDIGAIVAHTVDTLAPLARERGVDLRIQRAEEGLEVFGDRDELIRVFENLVENGIKYGASGGRVDVTIERSRRGTGRLGEAVIAVRDYGPGIAAEHLPRLTERFYRVDVSQSRDKGGTGLGLAIVKHIVARHRGRLLIDSRPGEGATFTIRIDLAETP
ncbi:MAG: ATP-binding protein [Labrys sp. (in: a-proteobacteria)]|jgi:two-component system phosphate regulon sensor histidine kinase PhoR